METPRAFRVGIKVKISRTPFAGAGFPIFFDEWFLSELGTINVEQAFPLLKRRRFQ